MRRQHAFTLVEMLIVIALAAIVLTLAAPSFRNFILVQRLKSVNAQLVTDLQFARSEAVSRSSFMRLAFDNDPGRPFSCYTIYTALSDAPHERCKCYQGAGQACIGIAGSTEVRTVQVDRNLSVEIKGVNATAFAFDHVTGALVSNPVDNVPAPRSPVTLETHIDSSWLRTTVGRTGRPTVCGSSAAMGFPAC